MTFFQNKILLSKSSLAQNDYYRRFQTTGI